MDIQVVKESGHWYLTDGSSFHVVEMATKKGQFRKTKKPDAIKAGAVPSVTSVMKVKAMPYLLFKYVIDKAVNAAVDNILDTAVEYIADKDKFEKENLKILNTEQLKSYLINISREQGFEKKVEEDRNKHKEETAKQGTDIHALIERWINGEDVKHKVIDNFVEVLEKYNLTRNMLTPERGFASKHYGYGGCVDVLAPTEGVLIDLKSKDFKQGATGKSLVYPENSWQLAAYAALVRESKISVDKCVNVYIDRQNFDVLFYEHDMNDINGKHFDMFLAMLRLWYVENEAFKKPEWLAI